MMWISVRAFASYREAIGAPSVRMDVPAGSTPSQVWDRLLTSYPPIAGLPEPHAFAINEEYIEESYALRERDELVLIPPVSGGAPKSTRPPQATQATQSTAESVELTDRAIDVKALLKKVSQPRAGADVLFLGTVRDNERRRHVNLPEKEADPPTAQK